MTRQFFKYLMITFITSSISSLYFHQKNKKRIKEMDDEIYKLHLEKNKVELCLKPQSKLRLRLTLETIISDIDDYLTLLMKEINESNINDINEDLRNEIHSICNRIIEVIPKKKNISSESLSSTYSFDTLNIDDSSNEDN